MSIKKPKIKSMFESNLANLTHQYQQTYLVYCYKVMQYLQALAWLAEQEKAQKQLEIETVKAKSASGIKKLGPEPNQQNHDFKSLIHQEKTKPNKKVASESSQGTFRGNGLGILASPAVDNNTLGFTDKFNNIDELDFSSSRIVGGKKRGKAKQASVPSNIKVEADGFSTKNVAAKAFGKRYGPTGVKNKQELQGAISFLGKDKKGNDNWGYLTPGWGPKNAEIVDVGNLFTAYRKAGFSIQGWLHGHYTTNTKFSPTDYGSVWGETGARKTYLVILIMM